MPIASVGQAFGVLRGNMTGDPEEAQQFLENKSPFEIAMRNRVEARSRVRRKLKNYKMGRKSAWQ